MIYVLDTNTLSFAMGEDRDVCERLVAHERTQILLPQPVIAKVEYGLERLPASRKKTRLTERFRLFVEELPRALWTDRVSAVFGQIKADLEKRGTRLEDFDLAVAAHALTVDGVLVTDNVKHMSRVAGLRIENWR